MIKMKDIFNLNMQFEKMQRNEKSYTKSTANFVCNKFLPEVLLAETSLHKSRNSNLKIEQTILKYKFNGITYLKMYDDEIEEKWQI